MPIVELDDCTVEYVDGGRRLVLVFGETSDLRIAYDNWDAGMGLHYWKNGSWEASNFDPGIILLKPEPANIRQDPMHEFIRTIPGDARKIATHFQYNQYTVLRLLRRGPLAGHMATHNPALLGLVLEFSAKHDLEDYQVDSLLRMKRDQLLEYMGYDVPKWAPRFLAKLALKKINEGLIHSVGRSLHQLEVASYLKRFEQISETMLLKALYAREFLGCRLCQGINHGVKQREITLGQVASLAPDTYRMGAEVMGEGVKQMIMRCVSIRQLRALHDEMMCRWQVLELQKARHQYGDKLPDPPLPGNNDIRPITTMHDLWYEGQKMHHCVASYADAIVDNEIYIYSVLKPERATLSIGRYTGGLYIHDLKLACNEEPSIATKKMVAAWFEDYNGRKSTGTLSQ